MKNLYNTIEQNLKAGLNVVVKDLEDSDCYAIGTNKDKNGNYRYSGWCNSVQIAKKNIGLCSGQNKDYWDKQDLEIVEVYRPEFEPFKIGQKVRLLDSIKNTGDWEDIKNKFPDMIGEIEYIFSEVLGTQYKVNSSYIGHEHLAPLVEQEVEELTMEEVCKLLGREVKIKK